jgi:hypothetical protein
LWAVLWMTASLIMLGFFLKSSLHLREDELTRARD